MTDPERRMTPTERLHEVTMSALGRPQRTRQEEYELGESAQGRPYVKSLRVYREAGEDEAAYLARGLRMLAELRDGIAIIAPPTANGAE